VTRLTRAAGGWRVEALGGSVLAPAVVLATNAYATSHFWPALDESLIPMRAYQLVSKPLGEHARASILPEGQPLTDTRRCSRACAVMPMDGSTCRPTGPCSI
jgi:glycine/D-amino acid oxidase-like deaminating enzyme